MHPIVAVLKMSYSLINSIMNHVLFVTKFGQEIVHVLPVLNCIKNTIFDQVSTIPDFYLMRSHMYAKSIKNCSIVRAPLHMLAFGDRDCCL